MSETTARWLGDLKDPGLISGIGIACAPKQVNLALWVAVSQSEGTKSVAHV